MHTETLHEWRHDHVFGQDKMRSGERRTLLVVILTAAMMVVEIAAGLAFGSMALLADGLHMASHATALGISVAAYVLARRFAAHPRFSFGTGKVNALAGFTSAVLLVVFAVGMVWESTGRFIEPVSISFDQAIVVAVLGLVVNGISAVVLAAPGHHHHDHAGHSHPHHHDHNLRAAYLHVLADALTSVLAIVALLAGKLMGAVWLDPAMGIVGALLVARWSWGLLRSTGDILLDRQLPDALTNPWREAIEKHAGDRIADLHVWNVGPGIHAAELVVITDAPQSPDQYKRLAPDGLNIVHATVEVHCCGDHVGN